jgi:hypothetical protein
MAMTAAVAAVAVSKTADGFVWPASLAAFGDGYPSAGDVCRRLGESPATSAYLDHMATLVGCPGDRGSDSARAIERDLHGRVVGEAHGVTLISVPDEAGVAAGESGTLRCAHRVGQRLRACRFEITRGDDRSAVLVVHLPGGGTRAIFFAPDGMVVGVASKAGDRPTRGKVSEAKKADVDVISVGAERYEVPARVLER